MSCDLCRETPGLVAGAPKLLDGRAYSTFDPCPRCKPHIPEPSKVGSARSNNPDGKNLRDTTEDWINSHPAAARLFLKFARELASRGRKFGVKLLMERIRWECVVEGLREGEYRLNNNMTAYLGRWLIGQDASLERFIAFRQVKYK